MAKQKHNHTCVICGNTYYACNDCDEKQAIFWRSICCSPMHYQMYHILAQWRDNQISQEEAQLMTTNIGIKPDDIQHFSTSSTTLAEQIFAKPEVIEEVFDEVVYEVIVQSESEVETKPTKKKTKSSEV